MKKAIVYILTAVMILSASLTLGTAAAEAAKKEIIVKVNGSKVVFPDTQPFLDENERVQVPVRFVSQALGASVEWIAKSRTVEITKGSDKVILQDSKKEYTVNGVQKAMDTVATNKSGRILVPIRFVSEALGATVTWDGKTSTVSITIKPAETVKVGSFTVPTNTLLSVTPVGDGSYYETCFLINYGYSNEKTTQMINDVESILLQKLDKSTVDKIIAHAKKKKLDVFLQGIDLYDQKSNRWIHIEDSYAFDLTIYVCTFGK